VWVLFIFWSSKIRASLTGIDSSIFPLRCLISWRHITSPLEPKPKHWIHTTATDHSPRTAWLTPSTAIKRLSHLDHSLHHSTASPFYVLSSQSTTLSELYPPLSFSFTVVPRSSSLHTTTPMVMNKSTIFYFPIIYRHLNSRKKIFLNFTSSRKIIN
jgi:hypothetical protein